MYARRRRVRPIVTMIKNDTDVRTGPAQHLAKRPRSATGDGTMPTRSPRIGGLRRGSRRQTSRHAAGGRTEGIFNRTAAGSRSPRQELIERGVIPRTIDRALHHGPSGLKTPDSLQDRCKPGGIKPSLSAFDRAWADLKSQTS